MEEWEGSPSFSGQQNFDGKHQRWPYGPEHDKLEELPNLGPNLRSSPGAHLSGATTPNKGAVGSIGPPFLTKSPQGPDSAPAFKPVGLPGKDSLHVHDLSPLQRSRAAALQQQQQMFPNGGKPHQHQHQNLRASVGLEPGGGLTNPGPGPFGRGPSPLEGHLGRGPSPPNPPNGLSRDAMTPPPSLDERAERMSRMKVSPSQLSPSQLRQLAQLAGGNSPLTGGNNDVNMLAAQMFFLQQQQQQQMHQGMPQQRLQPQPMRSQINQSLQMQNQQQQVPPHASDGPPPPSVARPPALELPASLGSPMHGGGAATAAPVGPSVARSASSLTDRGQTSPKSISLPSCMRRLPGFGDDHERRRHDAAAAAMGSVTRDQEKFSWLASLKASLHVLNIHDAGTHSSQIADARARIGATVRQ